MSTIIICQAGLNEYDVEVPWKERDPAVHINRIYYNPKGWEVIRPIKNADGAKLAMIMRLAADNENLKYCQECRYDIIKNGVLTNLITGCDASSLVRECIIEAMGFDPGDFITADEKYRLLKSGQFTAIGDYFSGMDLQLGDILVTKTKGTTAIVVRKLAF